MLVERRMFLEDELAEILQVHRLQVGVVHAADVLVVPVRLRRAGGAMRRSAASWGRGGRGRRCRPKLHLFDEEEHALEALQLLRRTVENEACDQILEQVARGPFLLSLKRKGVQDGGRRASAEEAAYTPGRTASKQSTYRVLRTMAVRIRASSCFLLFLLETSQDLQQVWRCLHANDAASPGLRMRARRRAGLAGRSRVRYCPFGL